MSPRLEQLLVMLEQDPKDHFVRYAVALEYAAAGDTVQAIARIEALIADEPDYLGAYYKLGQLHDQNGDSEKALDVYTRGAEVARKQNNMKTLGELNTAIDLLD